MARYEYKVVPAPVKGKRAKGVKGNESKFAFALETVMNDMGADGWEYQRAETLPSEERSGLTSKTTTYRNVLVFRRQRLSDPEAFEPKLLDPPSDVEDEIEKEAARDAEDTPASTPEVDDLDPSEDETRL